MKSALQGLLLICATSLSSLTLASPLNDYNLILTGDYHYKGGQVQGATFIGGSLNAAGQSPTLGTRAFANANGLTVAGNVRAANVTLQRGNLVYGGSLQVQNVNMNGRSQTIIASADLSVASLAAQLEQESAAWAQQVSNGTFSKGTLSYDGADGLAVFDLDFNQLFANNSNLKLSVGSASQVVINVRGSTVNMGGGVNLSSGFRSIGAANILWNFHEATNINFNGVGMVGAVLALNADTRGGAMFDGSFAARSYSGSRDFNQYGFNLRLPEPPPQSIPEPTGLALLLSSLLAIFLVARTRLPSF